VRVFIAGAGIGGLSAALSLHAAGIDAQVIDSAPVLRPRGTGIHLLPHAVRELTELGLGDELAATGIQTAEISHFDRHGNQIWSFACGRDAGYDWPHYSICRGDLQMILLDAVRSRLGADAVRTGMTLTSFEEAATKVVARVTGETGSTEADVLVGADGLYSRVRAQLHPGEARPRESGVRQWRGLTPGPPFLTGRVVAACGTNASLKFVAYPVSRKAEVQGRALITWIAEMRIPGDPDNDEDADWNRQGRIEDVLPFFAEWGFGWLDIPALITGAEQILERPMVDRDPLPFWGRGRVTLLGDAAHPMYPIGKNSLSQAIIDARVLAYELARADSPPAGLAAYEAARRETMNALVLACRDMPADPMLQLVSSRAPDGFDQVSDILTAAEIAAFDVAYHKTTLLDVTTLNTRPSLTVSPRPGLQPLMRSRGPFPGPEVLRVTCGTSVADEPGLRVINVWSCLFVWSYPPFSGGKPSRKGNSTRCSARCAGSPVRGQLGAWAARCVGGPVSAWTWRVGVARSLMRSASRTGRTDHGIVPEDATARAGEQEADLARAAGR
jgi:2-polyprenyl-6-methoxyphenol hydroxylase-like FAD-dependent oxidoreductase